jgi:hypothetical protein
LFLFFKRESAFLFEKTNKKLLFPEGGRTASFAAALLLFCGA